MKTFIAVLAFGAVLISCKKNAKDDPVVPAPELNAMDKTSAAVGDAVNISGKNFNGDLTVYFDNTQATIVSKNATQARVIVPQGSGTVNVSAQNGNASRSNTLRFTYTTDPALTPEIIYSNLQSAEVGDTLTIAGQGFHTDLSVLFGTAEATVVTRSSTRIIVIVPVGNGNVKIKVKNKFTAPAPPVFSNEVGFSYKRPVNDNYRLLTIGGLSYNADTLSYIKIGPGTHYLALKFQGAAGTKPIRAFLTMVDVTNPFISIRSAVGRDSVSNNERPSAMAVRKSSPGNRYIAGTNSDFFNTTTGYPRNANMVDGVLASVADNKAISGGNYAGVAIFDAQNQLQIDNLTYSGSVTFGNKTMSIDTLNYYNHENADHLAFYNSYTGKTTSNPTAPLRTEVAITPVNGSIHYTGETDMRVVAVHPNSRDNAVSSSISILAGASGAAADFLNQLKQDDVIKLKFSLTARSGKSINPYNLVGGRQIIMRNNTVAADFWNGTDKHPRTGIGFSHNGSRIYLCVIDGRSTIAADVKTSEMAQIMQHYGATDALNLDGGGSSTMYLDKIGTVNNPSDGTERSVVAGVFAVSNAPDDNQITELASKEYLLRLAKGATHNFVFYGLNKYGQIVTKNPSNVSIISNGLGTVSGAAFTAGQTPASGYIIAVYQGIKLKIRVLIQ
ncbi:phosphodiester glycosidase family protein [Niabella aurantiaca]|uniref:phosphodiester glycosidase family protein n=1 Tax=Niabella aurantiaca TaxID=379900 RepID=UPI00146E83E5|nr:phosphodiester glycosidase family protein [Niabella aurantiaca]